jgi:hypothetical protein
MWVLLCGTGLGFSVQKHHIKQLPDVKLPFKGKKKYVIDDSIEGWSDAVGVIINSFFTDHSEFQEYCGYDVEFDYSKIRPEGSYISGGFKAPGPKGLERSIEKIRDLIKKRINQDEFQNDEFRNKLRPIDCFDSICYFADAVLSGGVRRSALLTLFSYDDEEMAKAKTGNWFVENPQRGRSNNSAALNKKTTTRKQFSDLMKSTKEFGEPGFIWVDDESNMEAIYNPCLPEWSLLKTKCGIKELKDVNVGDLIWSKEGWTTVIKKWSTGIKKVYEYKTTGGTFYSTDNHQIVSGGEKIEVGEAESIDTLTCDYYNSVEFDTQIIMDGLVFGDGTVHKASNNLVHLCIGDKDHDYFESEISDLIEKHRPGLHSYAYEIKTDIVSEEIPKTYDRKIPLRYKMGDRNIVCSFLRGLYSANGSIAGKRVTLKASSFDVIKDVQVMLSSIGIRSYYTVNKSKNNKFSNGEYIMRESYDLNITGDKDKFYAIIGFIQKYKEESLEEAMVNKSLREPKKTFDIKEVNLVSEEEVFDITVDNESHTFWCNGFDTSNCCEIGMIPISDDGEHGVQVCNLCEINGKYCSTEERFYEACKASAIIGTLQAAYTDFKYLTQASRDICDKEALLGCSITGLNDNPDILLNPEIQRKGAEIIKQINKEVAEMIGINRSARTTCVKPSGSTSCLLQTASGIHPHHAKRYLRRVQANKNEFALEYFKKFNSIATEDSVWSNNKTDEVISFVCEVPDGAKTKNQIKAIELLEQVKLTQQNWVMGGTNLDIGYSNRIKHNVSNTISIIDENEWEEAEEFIWKNREWFAGISLIPSTGDLDYAQAPFATVLTPTELFREYGDASVFASGLIVDGLRAFDNNLWKACDTALGYGEDITKELTEPTYPIKRNNKELANYFIEKEKYEEMFLKQDWVRRVKQFSERYFSGDLRKSTYCLKHVSLWKTFCDLSREYQDVPWEDAIEIDESLVAVDTLAAAACAGGKCLVEF